jgi:putative copper resistance protein D
MLLQEAVPEPTGAAMILGAWKLDPVLLVVVLVAGTGYAAGMRSTRRRGISWPAARPVAFFAGLVVTVVAAMSALGSYAHVLFSVYMVQILLLLTIAPLLLAIGRPIGLAVQTLPEPAGQRLVEAMRSRPVRIITSPVISPLLFVLILFAVFFTPWYQASLQHYVHYELLHLVLLIIGFAAQIPLWETGENGHGFPYPLLLLFTFIELLADAVPGIVLRLDTHVIAPAYYLALHRSWGPSPLSDQQLGADILWCVAEAIDLPFLILFLAGWIRADATEADRIDHALERPSQLRSASPDHTDHTPVEQPDRPWWESDASVFGDRAHQFQRFSR